jgi:hypothetical protein
MIMVTKLKYKALKGWEIRIRSALRCLFYKKYVLVCWTPCEDGDLDFKVTHKGIQVSEAVRRLKADAYEILQNKSDQDDAIDEVNALIKK